MIVWDYPAGRAGLLAVMCGLTLAGCSKKADVTTEALEDYRGTRGIGRVAWKVERHSGYRIEPSFKWW